MTLPRCRDVSRMLADGSFDEGPWAAALPDPAQAADLERRLLLTYTKEG